jgi:hypothetical protein
MADAIIEFLLSVVLVWTGRIMVPIISLGRWRGASLQGKEEKIYGAAGALSFVRDGRRVVTTTGMGLLGFLFYFCVVATLVAHATS